MKANISLEKSTTNNKYYLVINDRFYIEIKRKCFYELAAFLLVKGIKK